MMGLADLFFNFNSLVTASEKTTHKGKGSEVKAHDCIRLTMGHSVHVVVLPGQRQLMTQPTPGIPMAHAPSPSPPSP